MQVTLLFDPACMGFIVQLCFSRGRADGCCPESVPIEKQLPKPLDVTAEFLYYFILAVALMVVTLRNYIQSNIFHLILFLLNFYALCRIYFLINTFPLCSLMMLLLIRICLFIVIHITLTIISYHTFHYLSIASLLEDL